MSSKSTVLYFGYGSNLWLDQMERRCPNSTYVGIGRLRNYKWIINKRGYANVVGCSSQESIQSESASEDHESSVYGLIYALTTSDEANLDINEGVPEAYTKEDIEIEFWSSSEGKKWVNVNQRPEEREMLVYIDRKRTDPDQPKKEYCHRMNMGIDDALAMGVPPKYIETVLRKFIPAEVSSAEVKEIAERQALHFKDGL